MIELDELEARFAERRKSHGIRRNLEIANEGLVLGADTLLAGRAPGNDEPRVFALLAAAHGRALAPRIFEITRKALDLWSQGEKCLAQLHLTYARLAPLTEDQAFALFAADALLECGLSPAALMKGLGLDSTVLDALAKYNPDQPRVPAGNGRASGQWGPGSGGAPAPVPAVSLIGHGQVLSDISVDPAGPTVQVAQSVTMNDLPDGTPVAPYGEKVVSFKNLPMNARQILQYRVFVQDDATKEWHIGMDLPMPPLSEFRATTVTRGPDAGKKENGYIIAPPGSPPLPEEGSRKEPRSGIRYGIENPYTGQPYFKVFNDSDGLGGPQPISPVTGRTVPRDSPEAHYPVDPVGSSTGTALNALFHALFGGE